MRYNHTSRLLSIVLVLTLLIQMLPMQALAAQNNNAAPEEQADSATHVTVVGEEVALRDEGEKHFRLSDGTYLAVTYGTPVHYMDSAGNWKDIDNRPVMATDMEGAQFYQIANADKSTSFSSALTDGTIFTTSTGEFSVSMQLLDTVQTIGGFGTANITADANAELITSVAEEELLVFSRSAVAELEENIEVYSADEEQVGWQISDLMPDNITSSLIYEDVFPGIDLRYEASGYNIKEEIIIRQPQNSYRYDFLLTLDGLTARLNDNGSVDLLDADNAVIYEIPAPYMYDGAGEISEAVAYVLREVEDGVILTVVADDTWIHDASREFPVTIDPTLNLSVSTSNNGEDLNMYITYVEENTPTQTAQGTDTLYIGYGSYAKELRGYIHLKQLPDLPVGSIITQASLSFLMGSYSEGSAYRIPVGIYELEDNTAPPTDLSYRDWIRYMNWNTKPEIKHESVIDYNFVSNQTVGRRISWDITELVKTWYYEKTENRTVAMTVNTQENGVGNNGVATFVAYGASYAPALIVSYRNNLGIEPYYTYTTLGAGAAGAAYIADATGQIRIMTGLLGYSSNVNPYSLGLVYNSDYFASDVSADYQPLMELGLNMSVGSGWRLSCVEKIIPETISGTTYLKYYDGDGTIHYFLPYNNAYYDEDGLGLKIVSKGNNAYEMTDDHGNKWSFTNSFLTTISDEVGNQILIKYDSGKLIAITQKNKNGQEITVASFVYTGNMLTSIKDATEKGYSFSYSENKLKSIVKEGIILAQYEYPNLDDAENGYLIKQMTDFESGYQILFSYNSSGKVSSFWEKAGETDGARVDISYPNYSQTVYRDYGIDQADSDDDILTYYLFDHAGRTVNAYSTDTSGNILGATNAVYSGSGSTDKTNNRTLRTASIGIAGQHLLKNPSFETEDGWNFGSSRQQTNVRTGKYALILAQDVTSSAVNLTEDKTYTFSAYVDTSAVTGFSGQGIYLKASGDGDTWEGIPVNYQTTQDNKWARISVTFTAPSTGAYTLSICNDGASGAVYVDDVQLETGEAPSNFNLLENGSLSLGDCGWDWSTGAIYAEILEDGTINRVIQIAGSPNNAAASACQTVAINLPSTETYVLSGWVTADAVPDTANTTTNPARDTNKQCGLRAAIRYTDNSVEYHYVPFNTDLSSKQFVSYTIVPNPTDYQGKPIVKTVKEIVITCAYETNANIAIFDDISLVREITQTMEYDTNGNLKSVTTSGLNVDINTYQGGNLIKTVTGSQGVFQYTYDSTYKHRLTSVTNRASENSQTEYITQSMEYDGYGNVISTTLAGPGDLTMSTSAEYTNSGNLLSTVTDATGATVTYGYEEITHNGNVLTTAEYSRMMGLPTAITAPNETTTYTAYDLCGRVTQTSVADLATLLYNYSKGNLHEITRSYIKDGQEKTQTYTLDYDPFGKTSSISVGNRQLASYDYLAGNGLLSKQTYGNGHEVSFTYDNLGRTKTVTHKDGPTLSYAYTGDGQLHSVTETNGSNSTVYLYRYDSLGNLVGSEKLINNSLVLRTHHSYDTDNRLSAQGWQIGSTSFSQTYNYGEWDGNLSSMTFSQDSETLFSMTYGYDGLRRLISTNNGLFGRNYAYNSNGNQTTSQVSSLTYTGPACSFAYGYTYDSMGNIETYSDGNGTITYEYDAQGQLLGADVNGDQVNDYVYTYDAVGNILTANGHEYTYDNADWIDLLTKYDGQQITYDSIGNPLSYYNGTRWEFTWTQGRQLQQAFTTSDTQDLTIEYTYDADGLRTGKTVSTKTYSEHECDYTVTVVSPTCVEGGYTLHECSCGESYQDAETPALGHDFVTTVVDPTGTTPGYTQYTCTRCGYTYSNHTHSYTAGQVIAPTCTQRGYTIYQCLCGAKDERNFVNALGHDYTNSFGRPSQTCKRCGHKQGDIDLPITPIVPPGGGIIMGEDTGSAEIMSVYADENRTLESTVVTEYEYIYAGTKLVRMIVTTTVDDGTPTVQTLDFAYDASGMPVTVTTGGNTYYYITNLQGDVMALLNSTGTAVAQYNYDPYGNIIEATGDLAEINPLTYRGYVYDTETQLYYLQSRYYDPKIGRFLNADSLVSTGQGVLGFNMFAYCGNNPINHIDPTGDLWRVIIPIIIGLIPTLSGCSGPNDDAPEGYVQENSKYQNCYSYAFGLSEGGYPGMYSIPDDSPYDYMLGDPNRETYIYTPEEITNYVLRDMAELGIAVRKVNSPSERLDGEYIVAMKTSTDYVPGYLFADVHFAVLLNNGMWADKQGMEPSRWGIVDGSASTWDIIAGDGYYNTETVYFAVGGRK